MNKTLAFKSGDFKIEALKKMTKLTFLSATQPQNQHIKLSLTQEEVLELIQALEPLCQVPFKKEERPYSEEISIYRNEVERSLSIDRGQKAGTVRLSLDVYTDQDYDDNWTVLTQKRLGLLIGTLYGHIASVSSN